MMGLANALSCALEGNAPPMRMHASNNLCGQEGQLLVLVRFKLIEANHPALCLLYSNRFWSPRREHLPMPRHEGRQVTSNTSNCFAGFTAGSMLAVAVVLLGVFLFLQHHRDRLRMVSDTLGYYLPLVSTPEAPSAVPALKDPIDELRPASNCSDVQDASATAGSFASNLLARASHGDSEKVRIRSGCGIEVQDVRQGELELGTDDHSMTGIWYNVKP
jgi:hypothetical protein